MDTISAQNTDNFFSPIDVHFARLMQTISGRPDPSLMLAAALVSRATGNGAACLDLPSVASQPVAAPDNPEMEVICPPLETWLETLAKSRIVGKPGDYRPLILTPNHRLYLLRYFEYEQRLAAAIRQLTANRFSPRRADVLKDVLGRLFGRPTPRDGAMQMLAVLAALHHGFTLVTGGPGTGKTYTLARILAALMLVDQTAPERIMLAAPTGKAAARLGQAMSEARQAFQWHPDLARTMPVHAITIHRLLRARADGSTFLHDARNPVQADVVVVDEASMVDLALMVRLVEALPQGARLILAGDKDQLVSVESGSVLGDICHEAYVYRFSPDFLGLIGDCADFQNLQNQIVSMPKLKGRPGFENTSDQENGDNPLMDCIVVLDQVHRFGAQSSIDRLRLAVNSGDAEKALALLSAETEAEITWEPHWPSVEGAKRLKAMLLSGYRAYLQNDDSRESLRLFMQFQVLCAVNFGPSGVFTLNRLTESTLTEAGLLKMDASPWYRGRPVMITRNDHRQGLFNGDIGIALAAGGPDNDLKVFFQDPDGGVRSLRPHRLPEHQTVFAMTVHKSQGSEFDQIMLVLPEKENPVLTRELIYTGLTRARKQLTLWSAPDIFKAAIQKRISRTSGLTEALWEKQQPRKI